MLTTCPHLIVLPLASWSGYFPLRMEVASNRLGHTAWSRPIWLELEKQSCVFRASFEQQEYAAKSCNAGLLSEYRGLCC